MVRYAAYCSGERLRSEQTGELSPVDKRTARVKFKRVMAPADAPSWVFERQTLWNRAEAAEQRKDATLGREIHLSLPCELSLEQNVFLVQDFVRENFLRRNLAVDIAIHFPESGKDQRNIHAHLLFSERAIGPNGFAPTKDRLLKDKSFLIELRRRWSNLQNRHLARYGHTSRVDHRTLVSQGIERRPDVHIGPVSAQIASRGGVSFRQVARNSVRATNLKMKLAKVDDRHRAPTKSRPMRSMNPTNILRGVALGLNEARARDAAIDASTDEQEELDFRDSFDLWGVPRR